ncbi:MAG: Sec-independent protein translocase TatB [Microbacterium sp.]|uniref:Sec-independent protein translocase TatB n=1 Tax=Microbacterium sp. TaxID=51671 RepID=UPI0039E2ADCA
MFGLTVEKLLLLGALAAFLIGPRRLPTVAAGLRRLIVRIRSYGAVAQDRLRDDLGIDAAQWRELDPRRYDPRRIIRAALLEDAVPTRTPPPSDRSGTSGRP